MQIHFGTFPIMSWTLRWYKKRLLSMVWSHRLVIKKCIRKNSIETMTYWLITMAFWAACRLLAVVVILCFKVDSLPGRSRGSVGCEGNKWDVCVRASSGPFGPKVASDWPVSVWCESSLSNDDDDFNHKRWSLPFSSTIEANWPVLVIISSELFACGSRGIEIWWHQRTRHH